MIEFLWPWAVALLPLPLLVYFLVPQAQRTDAALQVPFYVVAAGYEGDSSFAQRNARLRRLLLVLMWLALVLAATRPQYFGDPIELPSSGRDLLLAVDISGSMSNEDMQLQGKLTSRLQIVKQIVGQFVERRVGDRLGLILFGDKAYLQVPLTFDRFTVRTLLEETPVGVAGQQTAIGYAIGLAVKRLQDRPAKNRVLILLTDGVNTVGEVEPIQAAKLAAQAGIRIHTIGFGADEMIQRTIFGSRVTNPSAELDTEGLTQIANLTGGIYQRARSTDELKQIYAALDELEPIEQDKEIYRPTMPLFFYPLTAVLLLSLFYAALHPMLTTWFLSLIRERREARRKPEPLVET